MRIDNFQSHLICQYPNCLNHCSGHVRLCHFVKHILPISAPKSYTVVLTPFPCNFDTHLLSYQALHLKIRKFVHLKPFVHFINEHHKLLSKSASGKIILYIPAVFNQSLIIIHLTSWDSILCNGLPDSILLTESTGSSYWQVRISQPRPLRTSPAVKKKQVINLNCFLKC